MVVLLLAACSGTPEIATTSTARDATTTTATAPRATTTTTVQLTTTTVAVLTCDEYLTLALPIISRVFENVSLMGDPLDDLEQGSISADDPIAVIMLGSADFAQAEEKWRSLGPVPPEFQRAHDLMLPAFGILVEAATLHAQAAATGDQQLFDDAEQLANEAADLFARSDEATPPAGSC